MEWGELRTLALKLRGVSADAAIVRVGDQPIVRLVDEQTVAFALTDADDRDAIIAAAPGVFSINARFEPLPVVLASLPALDLATAHARLRVAWESMAPPAPTDQPAKREQPRGPRLFMLLYVSEDQPERRTFKRLGHACVADWLLAAWRAWEEGLAWGDKLPPHALSACERAFERLSDEGGSARSKNARAFLLKELGCGEHTFSAGDHDWELLLFDEDFMATEASDYIPHPERGERPKNRDDGYRELLAKHKKHRRTTKSR